MSKYDWDYDKFDERVDRFKIPCSVLDKVVENRYQRCHEIDVGTEGIARGAVSWYCDIVDKVTKFGGKVKF